MLSESNHISINLESFSTEVAERVSSLQTDGNVSLEDAFREYLRSDKAFSDTIKCPVCSLSFNKSIPLRGLPIVEAEKLGFIKINSDLSRDNATDIGMYFVICPECLWWGIPDRSCLDMCSKR